jgi:acetoin:2,6-dichlorophenolindophenol oxidoreductase subunit alpha
MQTLRSAGGRSISASLTPTAIDLDAPIDLSRIDLDRALELYGRMALIREFEGRVNRLFLQGRIPGTIHLSHGQEACAVGGTASLRPSDPITITHRGHGQALAKGTSARSLMAELYARETGCCRGMGGSLHVGDWDVGALPAISIVGASIPIAAGLAFAARYLGDEKVAVCFTGDGATTEGDAHEGYNLASLWKVPVVYVCENNLYSISTRVDRQAPVTSVAERVRAYAIPAEVVDGNDVVAVTLAVEQAVQRARAGEGPSLVECLTYRQGGHKRDDPATYRPRDEVELWLRRDPLERMRTALEASGLETQVERALSEAVATIDDAVAFAEASPLATGIIE